jgi:hypothetical protein
MREAIKGCTLDQERLLSEIRSQVRGLRESVRTIKARSATSVSLVASDGGNNKLVFDPFFVQLIRVVDSYGKTLCLDAISPATDTDLISKCQFKENGEPKTALGKMMRDLGARTLNELSPMIPKGAVVREDPSKINKSWVQVCRDLCEWAVLYERICYSTFATDTLIVRDGLLRSKLFQKDLFILWRKKVEEAIERTRREDHRKVLLVGLAKHSKVIDRYGLAFALEQIFSRGEGRYVIIPRELERQAFVWQEWARGVETEAQDAEQPKFVAGDMYFVRFGPETGDPIWPLDIFSSQAAKADEIFGYLLGDARDGFPIPFYPKCLQKADEYAQVVDLDLDILQDEVFRSVNSMLSPQERDSLDKFRFVPDFTGRRYQ